ncbi:MAG: hypothetical protein QXI58_05015, partial [Candidatus Micrarchaeia archaeon]
MRCIICGRESNNGVWGKDGFVCSVCVDSYNFYACERCGLFFKRSEMTEMAGGLYCKGCAKEMKLPKIAKPRKIIKAGGRVRVSTSAKIEEELLPSYVEKRAKEFFKRDA